MNSPELKVVSVWPDPWYRTARWHCILYVLHVHTCTTIYTWMNVAAQYIYVNECWTCRAIPNSSNNIVLRLSIPCTVCSTCTCVLPCYHCWWLKECVNYMYAHRKCCSRTQQFHPCTLPAPVHRTERCNCWWVSLRHPYDSDSMACHWTIDKNGKEEHVCNNIILYYPA